MKGEPMWKKAEEVPKDDADEILEVWDKTDPSLQRLILLQKSLDVENLTDMIRRAAIAIRMGFEGHSPEYKHVHLKSAFDVLQESSLLK